MVYRILQVFVWLYCVNCALTAGSISTLQPILTYLPKTIITTEEASKRCPQLLNSSSAKDNKSLGIIEELESLCSDKTTKEAPFPCIGAVAISNYLCSASEKLVKSKASLVLPNFNSSLYENNTLLCDELMDKDLQNSSVLVWNKHSQNIVSPPFNMSDFFKGILEQVNCTAICTRSNKVCQNFLRGLKTIVSWTPLFDSEPVETTSEIVSTDTELPLTSIKSSIDNTTTVSSSIGSGSDVTLKPNGTSTPVTDEATVTKPKTEMVSDKVEKKNSSATVNVVPNEPDIIPEEEASDEVEKPIIGSPADETNEDDIRQNELSSLEDMDANDEKIPTDVPAKSKVVKPQPKTTYLDEPEDTHFIFYFIVFVVVTACCYIAYHRRTRILALIVEGRNSRRRPLSRSNSAGYKRLDNNLEEVITSSRSVKSPHVIY